MTTSGDFPAPRENALLVGHAAAEEEFGTAWRQDRLAHAWLVAGPPGIGKATLAYRIARRVLARKADGVAGLFGTSPSDLPTVGADHPNFRRIAAGGHADLMVVERTQSGDERAARDITVDQIRAMGRFLRLTPAEGGWRVVVLDSADDLNRNAANALLKILEEPPHNVLILLTSNLPGRLLPTIRSRCRRLTLSPLSTDQVETVLASLAPNEDSAEIALAARLSAGSPGRAFDLLLGNATALWRALESIIDALPNPDPIQVEALAERIARDKQSSDWRQVFGLLEDWLVGTVRGGAIGPVGDGEGAGNAGRFQPDRAGLEQWLEVWEKLTRLHQRTEAQNLDRKQAVISAVTLLEAAARSSTTRS